MGGYQRQKIPASDITRLGRIEIAAEPQPLASATIVHFNTLVVREHDILRRFSENELRCIEAAPVTSSPIADGGDLPATDDLIYHSARAATELFSFAERKVKDGVVADAVWWN